jgi:hypothetical protein
MSAVGLLLRLPIRFIHFTHFALLIFFLFCLAKRVLLGVYYYYCTHSYWIECIIDG